jgi:D-lactate dehydrogenase (cytochrome)
VPSASAAQITNMSRAATSSRFLRQQLQQRLECSRNGGALQLNSRRCYASKAKPEEKDEKESFKGQLYQSTAERLQRDKAEQARFAEHREAQRARSSPPWLVPFGMWSNWNYMYESSGTNNEQS